MTEGRRQISPPRKAIYYVGMAVMIAGLLLFLSTFLLMADGMSDTSTQDFFKNPHATMDRQHAEAKHQMGQFVFRGFGGMVLMAIGGGLMRIGRQGAAGAGLALDPQQAREDLEPWNRSTGGMINDTLSEIDVVKAMTHPQPSAPPPAPREVVKVRCPSCRALNEESAKFCSQCGGPI